MAYDKPTKRIIWVLSNGEKRYSSKRGQPEIWSKRNIHELITRDFKPRQHAYTADYGLFFNVPMGLSAGLISEADLPNLVYILDYIVESAALPVKPEYLHRSTATSPQFKEGEINAKSVAR